MGTLNKTAVIFAGGDFSPMDIKVCSKVTDINSAYIICADKGYAYCKTQRIVPNVVIGDFDSIERPNGDFEIYEYPPQKDDTDTMLAIKLAIERGYKEIVILGGLGGRFDHSIANVQAINFMADKDVRGYIIDRHHIITVLSSKNCIKINKYKGYLSLFALSDTVTGVTIEGCEYNVKNATLKNNFPLGVSNDIVSEKAKISIKEGKLLIIENLG